MTSSSIATKLVPSTSTAFSCRDCGRRYEAPTPLAEQRWAKGSPCQMCGGRLLWPFDKDTAQADLVVVATTARCLVCGFTLPPGGAPLCMRCDVAHVVDHRGGGVVVTRAPRERAPVSAIEAVRARLSSSPRARLIDRVLSESTGIVDDVVVACAAAFVAAEADTSWSGWKVPVPMPVARDLCEHLFFNRGRTLDARTVGFSILDGEHQVPLEEVASGSLVGLLVKDALDEHLGIDLDEDRDPPPETREQRDGVCVLTAVDGAASTRLALAPTWQPGVRSNLLVGAAAFLVGDRITLARFSKTLPLLRPAVLAWLTRAVLVGAAGRAPTVVLPSALAATITDLDVDVDATLPLLVLPTRRFPTQPPEARR